MRTLGNSSGGTLTALPQRAAPPRPPRCRRPLRRGWATLLLCLVLVSGSAITTALLGRWAISDERRWSAVWAHTQAQALAQGGIMWALAHLEDNRAIDNHCQAIIQTTAPPADPDTFAGRMARPGRQLRCTTELQTDARNYSWQCDCSGSSVELPWSADDSSAQGVIDLDFSGSGEVMRLRVKTRVRQGSNFGPPWEESVLIRQDRQSVWREVIGSWQDKR